MKEHESLIMNARERIEELEASLFRQVCRQIGESSVQIMQTAEAIARTDALCSLGEVASRYGYVRPELNEDDAVEIRQGRHPVVERMLPTGVTSRQVV